MQNMEPHFECNHSAWRKNLRLNKKEILLKNKKEEMIIVYNKYIRVFTDVYACLLLSFISRNLANFQQKQKVVFMKE